MAKVFVSYARAEAKKVNQILAKLEVHGIKFWVDTRDIPADKDWPTEISKAIKNCKRFFLLMSHKSMSSDNIRREVQIAYENQKTIVILHLDDSDIPDEFRYALTGRQWANHSSRNWTSKIVTALDGNRKFFQKPKPSSIAPVRSTRILSKKPSKPKLVIEQLQHIFLSNETLHRDQYTAAISKLDELRSVVGSHWINPALAYNELVPRVYLLEKIDLLHKLIQDLQNVRHPASSRTRQLIQNELEELLQELNRKKNK